MSTYYVSTTGNDSNAGTQAHPFLTIQHAANVVVPGDSVMVTPGLYQQPSDTSLLTTTSGTSQARIQFISTVRHGALIRVSGMSSQLTGAFAWTQYGSYVDIIGFDISCDGRIGILVLGGSCSVQQCYIHDIPALLSSPNGGAGIDHGGDATATNNTTIGNLIVNIGTANDPSALLVHGIYHAIAYGTVWNNLVFNVSGGGINLWHAASNVTITNNLLASNGKAGIIIGNGDSGASLNDFTIVANNICYNNTGYGIEELGLTGTHNQYLNNCVVGNSSGAFSLQNGLHDQGTITANPQLCNYRSNGTGDYHLARTSPCIDAGTSLDAPAVDYEQIPRPQGAGYDIGPYEYNTLPRFSFLITHQ